MTRDINSLSNLDVLALTIWGEARSESMTGRGAVACVVMNRLAEQAWYGGTVREICLKNWQFSCWNVGDPNRDKMLGLARKDEILIECRTIAALAIAGCLADLTCGSTHYHTQAVMPDWAIDKEPVFNTENHLFYNNID